MARGRVRVNVHCNWSGGILFLLLWLCCYVTTACGAGPKAEDQASSIKQELFQGGKGLGRLVQLGIERVVFVTRLAYDDGHWYANIGYYCDDENHKAYAGNGKPDESKLYELNARTGEVKVLLDGNGGGIRDAQIDYDGGTILFSYRRDGEDYYNLYEMQIDGREIRRLTNGPYDDFEAAYLPDGDIVFVSTRCKRWVGCWMTQVGTLFRCDRNGDNISPLSFNPEHDNTPAVLPDGRVLYTRWEYVDRSQVGYHQLWAMNPDGTDVVAYFGNQQHYPLFIDAKAIPGGEELLLIDSPGHGRADHRGYVCTITAKYGPDDQRGYHRITRKAAYNDPWPIDDTNFLVASYKQILLGTREGELVPILTYKGQANVHEAVPMVGRPRERIMADRTDLRQSTGRMVLTDVYRGRNMEGVRPGQIKKLLILEALPKPVNFSGGMDLTSWLGTFMLERVMGTVPVEEDGSAYFEVPAGRTILFVALDGDDMSVKRMQSFTNVHPGEVLGCVGCHEHRTVTPVSSGGNTVAAVRRPASKIEPFRGLPDVLDFRRHIQPILDAHCVECHNYTRPEGKTVLTADLGACWSISYYTLLATGQVADGRNGFGGQKPRTIGSSASELMRKIDGSHYDVTVTPEQWRTIWMWLESGAPYAGTYGALRNAQDQARQGSAMAAFGSGVLNRRCRQCHGRGKQATALPLTMSEQERRELRKKPGIAPHERIVR
ncbi:MAG: PD40 domain-containing protein, partial [Planctomycetota bacterium]